MSNTYIFNIAASIIAIALLAAAQVTAQLAPPAGVLRVELPAGQDVMVSLPFAIDSTALDDTLPSDQLPDGSVIFKWDGPSQAYVSATLVGGAWTSDASGSVASDMTLDNGEGFILRNPGEADAELYLSGLAVIDEQITVALYPGLTLFASPFSSDTDVSSTPLAPEALTPQAQSLLMGYAYWHQNALGKTTTWSATPPYALLFSATDLPAIDTITVIDGTPTLSIATQGTTDPIDIFYRDIDASGAQLEPGAWSLATRIAGHNATHVQWQDSASSARAPLTSIAGRYYAATSAQRDADSVGVSDAWEILVNGTDPNATNASVGAGHVVAAKLSKTNLSTIYVDVHRGKDSVSKMGEAASGSKSNPKRTIASATELADAGDTIIVMAGSYNETVKLPDGVKMRISGKVRLY